MISHLFKNGEKLLTITEAANALGLPAWKLRTAVRNHLIPSYTLLNSRRYVLVSEVLRSMREESLGTLSSEGNEHVQLINNEAQHGA